MSADKLRALLAASSVPPWTPSDSDNVKFIVAMRNELPGACGYCGGAHRVSERVAEESPFCTACLNERIATRASGHAVVSLVEVASGAVVVRSPRHEEEAS